MNIHRLRSTSGEAVRRLGVLCAVLMWIFTSHIHGEDRPNMIERHRNAEIPVLSDSNIINIDVEKLLPWIQRYQSLANFDQRHALAFRLAHRGSNWPVRMSLMAIDPEISPENLATVAHLASAHYTNLDMVRDGNEDAVLCLQHPEPRVVAGYLKILRSARALKPDGSDREWPAAGPLDPKRLPKEIALVLKIHPILAIEVAKTLEVYGPLALKEADELLPLLLSQDAAVVDAAQSAILKIDPQGLAKLYRLEGKPMTPLQKDLLESYYSTLHDDLLRNPLAVDPQARPGLSRGPADWWRRPAVDLRESDGSPQSEMSQRYEELRRFLRFRRDAIDVDLEQDKEVAFYFRDHHSPGNWWRVLSSAYLEREVAFGVEVEDQYILCFASALYTQPGAQAELIRLLQDEDSRIAGGALNLIADMRLFKPGTTEYTDGDLVDPENMPAHIIKVLDRHPHLIDSVALCLRSYGTHASAQAEALVPYLLSDDTATVRCMRRGITATAPALAQKLEITFAVAEDESSNEVMLLDNVDGPPSLTPKQRELIEAHLKSRK